MNSGPKDYTKLTLYKGKIRTFSGLCDKFRRAGLDYSAQEAKKYIL